MAGNETGRCRICGVDGDGLSFSEWVRDTFTDHDKLQPGDIICHACQFMFEESSELLRSKVGKDKPQRMRNYSHFVVDGVWYALSKGDKTRMKELLLGHPFPELAVVAESGQKHILFRAQWNPSGSQFGYVQFEEHGEIVRPDAVRYFANLIEKLLVGFSKGEVQTGNYYQHRVLEFGVGRWKAYDDTIKPFRQSFNFRLALFLAQRKEMEEDDGITSESGGLADDNLAGHPAGLQAEVPEHLGAVREQHPQRSLYEQLGQVRQLTLFEDVSGHRAERGGPRRHR